MSLDVYLFGGMCDKCGRGDEGYSANITHNLGGMAAAAGVYWCVWRPEEHGIRTAEQLIEPLENALRLMKACPEYFMQFNASNGWGTYEHFVPWLERYLEACKMSPESEVRVSR